MSELHTLDVGVAGFLRQLDDEGFSATQQNGFATFKYVIPLGTRIGETIELGLQIPTDFPATPPPGPHTNPVLQHPGGAVHQSPLGQDWSYWSRPFNGWASSTRTVREYMAHVRNLFAQL
jgi:hypothetical protein